MRASASPPAAAAPLSTYSAARISPVPTASNAPSTKLPLSSPPPLPPLPPPRPSSPRPELDSAWKELLDAAAAGSSSMTDGNGTTSSQNDSDTRSKLLLSRVLLALDHAPLNQTVQTILLFLTSIFESDFDSVDAIYLEREFSTLWPFLYTFMGILGQPELACSDQYFLSSSLMQCLNIALLLVHRKLVDGHHPIRRMMADMEEMLEQLSKHHFRFASSVANGDAWEREPSPYLTHTLTATAALASASRTISAATTMNGTSVATPSPASSSAAFEPFELIGWRRVKQLAACRCCYRMWQEETTIRQQQPTAAALIPNLPACTCDINDDEVTSCSCPFSAAFLALPALPSRLTSHPFRNFFKLDLSLHQSDLKIQITSTQQLQFFTEKLLQIYTTLMQQLKEDNNEIFSASSGNATITKLRLIMSYASLPDSTLRLTASKTLSLLIPSISIPTTVVTPLLDFLHHSLAGQASRSARRQKQYELDLESLKSLQAQEDEQLLHLLEAIFGAVPIGHVHGYARAFVESALECMPFIAHPTFLPALTRMCTTLVTQFPLTFSTLKLVYLISLQQLQRVAHTSAAPIQVPTYLESFLTQISSAYLFPYVPLTQVWTTKFATTTSTSTSRLIQPYLDRLQQQEEKYSDMPSLERGTTAEPPRKNKTPPTDPDANANTPAKRLKMSHSQSLSPSNAAAASSTSSPMDTSTDLAIDAMVLSTATISPEISQAITILQPIFHELIHEAIPDLTSSSYIHPKTVKTESDAIVMLLRLKHIARVIGSQVKQSDLTLDNTPTTVSPICQRLSQHVRAWLEWTNILCSRQQMQFDKKEMVEVEVAKFFSILPTILQHMYALLEQCVAQFTMTFFSPIQDQVYHLCAWPLEWPKEALAPCPFSCLAASMRLLFGILPSWELEQQCNVMQTRALGSSHEAVKCMAIMLLPTFISQMPLADRVTKGKLFVQVLSRMIVPGHVSSSPSPIKGLNLGAAIAHSIGAIICAISSTTSILIAHSPPSPNSLRTRLPSFLPLHFADSTLVPTSPSPPGRSTSPSLLLDDRATLDLSSRGVDVYQELDDFVRPMESTEEKKEDVPMEDTPPSQETHPTIRDRTVTQPVIYNQPIKKFLAPLLSRLVCPHCDGSQSSTCATTKTAGANTLSFASDIVPFLQYLDLSQPLSIRWFMIRSLFRMLRHLPADEFLFTPAPVIGAGSNLAASIPNSPPSRMQLSPQQKSKAAAGSELPFSLSQMTGSGKKVKSIHALQPGGALQSTTSAVQPQSTNNSVASLSLPMGGSGSGSQQMDTTNDGDGAVTTDTHGPILHPLAVQLLMLLFDPSHVIRHCVVEQLESLVDVAPQLGQTNQGPFFALFASSPPSGGMASSTSNANNSFIQQCFEHFIICLTHIQTNSHMLIHWHQKLQRIILAATKSGVKHRVPGIEMDLKPSTIQTVGPSTALLQLQTLDCFNVSMLLTTFASIGQLALFTPLGSTTQQLLLWPLIEAMSHATENGRDYVDLQRLALAYFTRLAHAHQLTTNSFFFLHGHYLFEKIFHTQIQQTPELVVLIFNMLILQDGIDLNAYETNHSNGCVKHRALISRSQTTTISRSIDWTLRDLYREGVRMTVPNTILRHFNVFCVADSPTPPILQQLAKAAAFSDDAGMPTFLVSLLDSILSLVFRSPGDFTTGFIQNQLVPFFSVGLKEGVKQLLDFVVFVRSDVLFDLLWRMADERQAKQSRQVMNWIIHGEQEKAKIQTPPSRTTAGKISNYAQPVPSSAVSNAPLSASAAAQPFTLFAPAASESQLSQLILPQFLGVFTKLHALLTMNFASITLQRPVTRGMESVPVQIRVPHVYKIHAIHALAGLLQLSKVRLKGFIPKILASMQVFTVAAFQGVDRIATSDSSTTDGNNSPPSPIAFHLLCLWSIFIDTLISSQSIGEYLSTIVVTLVHVMEKFSNLQAMADQGNPASATAASSLNQLLFTMQDFNSYRSSLPTPYVPKHTDKPNLWISWISSLPEYLLEQALEPNMPPSSATVKATTNSTPLTPASFRSHCITHIAQIVNDLLSKPELTGFLKTIPSLPAHPSLQPTMTLLQNEFQNEVDRRMKAMAATATATDVQLTTATNRQLPPTAVKREDPISRSSDTYTTCAFYLHLERILTTIAHESDQVRNYTLKHFRFLLRDPINRACWESYCNLEIGSIFTTNASAALKPPRFTQFISELLQRCTDSNTDNKLLASECMGEIGAIDPVHLSGTISVKPPQFDMQHATHYRTVHLAHYLIQHLLVRSLRTAIETRNQDSALCAIQQLLKYCGIDRLVAEVAENRLVEVNGKLQLLARNHLEPELSRIIEARPAHEYLPHSALPHLQQRTQVYQALQLWWDFPADVRAIITPCLTSAYMIQDAFLQPRPPSNNQTPTLGFKLEVKNDQGETSLSGNKKSGAAAGGSGRKRKEMTTAVAGSSADANRMEIDTDEKNKPKTRTTPDRKKNTNVAPSTTTPAVPGPSTSPMMMMDDAPTTPHLTSSTIRELPPKGIYTRRISFQNWLSQLTRYLIVYTALPIRPIDPNAALGLGPAAALAQIGPSCVQETLLYQACISIVQSDFSVALFLLPYLVDHALRYGSDKLIEFIRDEIMIVLKSYSRTSSSSNSNSEEKSAHQTDVSTAAHSNAQLCIQAVFELLDTLQQWHVTERRKVELAKSQHALTANSAASGSNGSNSASHATLPLHYGHTSNNSSSSSTIQVPVLPSAPFPSTRQIDAYKQFLDSIPKKVLANAAFHCKAFTRALKYMESHLREQKEQWKLANEKRQAQQQATGKRSGRATMNSAQAAVMDAAAASSSAIPDGMITDGPGAGILSTDLDSFQHMYASLEEPDGMRGLALLRQKQSVTSQIKDLESMGKWAEALTCYDNCLQQDSTQLTYHVGMMECLRNLGQWQVGLNHAESLLSKPTIPNGHIRPLSVCAIQNAWRLRDWRTVDHLLQSKAQSDSSHFEVRLASLLSALSKADLTTYESELRRARKAVLSQLAAASWESYERAYPHLLQLQMISEVDQMKHAMLDAHHHKFNSANGTSPPPTATASLSLSGPSSLSSSSYSNPSQSNLTVKDALTQLSSTWSTRLRRTTQTFRIREQILCLRRVLYSQFDHHLECGMGWLQLAHQARKAQQFEVAQGALLHASQMQIPNTFIEGARLLRARGQLHDALVYLEKEAPPDMKSPQPTTQHAPVSNSLIMSQGTIDASFRGAPPVVKACLSATISLVLGKWIQESNAKESRDVIGLYNKAIHFQPKWEKAHFLLGKYYDELLAAESNRSRFGTLQTKQQQQQQEFDARGKPLPQKPRSNTVGASPDVVSKFLGVILRSYGASLTLGHKYLFQSMPRMLALWFEHSETNWDGEKTSPSHQLQHQINAAGGSGSSKMPQSLNEKFYQCHDWMLELTKKLPAYQWLTSFPQIISRLTHKLKPVYEFIAVVVSKVFADYPQQALWLLAPVTKSLDANRRGRCDAILKGVRNNSPASTNQLIDRSLKLFDQLQRICDFAPSSTKDKKKLDALNKALSIKDQFPSLHAMQSTSLGLIVPLQSQMTVNLPPLASEATTGVGASMDTPINGSMSYDNHYPQVCKTHRAFPSHQIMISSFGDIIEVLKSKEKPKKLSVIGTDGQTYAFLCKREVRGDMRKNSRMMEFNTVVNRLMRESGDSRSRHLSLRTFSVLPITEECGLIEWVPNTTGFRHLVRQTHDEEGVETCFATIKKLYDESHAQPGDPVMNEIKLYERLCEMYRPIFHKWFLTTFPEPYGWFQARLKYARSSAVWSMVGYVVGLGDRHGENILIDESNGDCVHVDFDCLFGKGLTLDKPERVPFRLTPNMVDALGISGVEGLFSSSAEVAMQVMRSNEQTMMSVLHTFIYDPLVEWKTTPNDPHRPPTATPGVTYHPNAVRILDEIELKLKGQVAKESLPLNVHGQVAQLIKEATSSTNLAQMYIGWMAWL